MWMALNTFKYNYLTPPYFIECQHN